MSAHRHHLGLALLLMIGTGAITCRQRAGLCPGPISHGACPAHSRPRSGRSDHAGPGRFRHHPGDRAHPRGRSRTDWSKVNISALREHLIDMDEVTMRAQRDRAATRQRTRDYRHRARVARSARSSAWCRRTLMSSLRSGWDATTEDLPNGVKLIVTASDPRQVVKLKALGFMGIMVQGAHHQTHHLMMAKGEFSN